MKEYALSIINLLSSTSTLFCCALPALLVSVGAGSVLVSIIGTFPVLIWISKHKIFLFLFAGIMLFIGGILQFKMRKMPCPIDPIKKKACIKVRKINSYIYYFSLSIYTISVLVAYIIPQFM